MSIFIPKKINVGFQKRDDTYTGKLAYIIYYDETGKLRKEKSWNGWRDKKIPNEEFDNVPTEGFVLNKSAGGVEHSYGWDTRKSYCRVYDPRGFEFEIGIENLLYILEYCSTIPGKGVQGEFVYGWNNTDLILIPIVSPDYKKHMEYSNTRQNKLTIKVKDLITGATYLTKDNKEWIYMGKFDYWSKYYYEYKGKIFKNQKSVFKWCDKNDIPYPKRKYYSSDYYLNYATATLEKRHCFVCKSETGNVVFEWLTSINNKFIDVVDSNCCDDYAELYFKLEGTEKYSPIDHEQDQYFPMTYDDFFRIFTFEGRDGKLHCYNRQKIIILKNENILNYVLCENSSHESKFTLELCNSDKEENCEVLDLFPTETREEKYGLWGDKLKKKEYMIPVTLREIFDVLHPVYRQVYLKNGREYRKEYSDR